MPNVGSNTDNNNSPNSQTTETGNQNLIVLASDQNHRIKLVDADKEIATIDIKTIQTKSSKKNSINIIPKNSKNFYLDKLKSDACILNIDPSPDYKTFNSTSRESIAWPGAICSLFVLFTFLALFVYLYYSADFLNSEQSDITPSPFTSNIR